MNKEKIMGLVMNVIQQKTKMFSAGDEMARDHYRAGFLDGVHSSLYGETQQDDSLLAISAPYKFGLIEGIKFSQFGGN